jgi:succinate dehydrogenase/fumarate reductase flavoprotein subunit
MKELRDVIIVGSGLSGLRAAKVNLFKVKT